MKRRSLSRSLSGSSSTRRTGSSTLYLGCQAFCEARGRWRLFCCPICQRCLSSMIRSDGVIMQDFEPHSNLIQRGRGLFHIGSQVVVFREVGISELLDSILNGDPCKLDCCRWVHPHTIITVKATHTATMMIAAAAGSFSSIFTGRIRCLSRSPRDGLQLRSAGPCPLWG